MRENTEAVICREGGGEGGGGHGGGGGVKRAGTGVIPPTKWNYFGPRGQGCQFGNNCLFSNEEEEEVKDKEILLYLEIALNFKMPIAEFLYLVSSSTSNPSRRISQMLPPETLERLKEADNLYYNLRITSPDIRFVNSSKSADC